MNYRSGSQIREDFLRFFETKMHRRVHSSSLVPANDPTLLFTNAGMNQFKDVFLGVDKRAYSRAATSQKCVRAGGKHNDLENVGFTRRHHTFFEMLGNFSFGDYFKRDAIAFAWELLTSPEWFGIDTSRLYVTVFCGEKGVARDDEAERLWIETGVPKERIFKMGMKDNFWQMGETGPCGPCSEIFYDLGLNASEHTGPDGQPEDRSFPDDEQRYVEIWNLVFMQFDRAADGILTPLPKPSIDTGMGLERIACVLQGKLSNYETDLFTPLIARAAELTGFTTMPIEEAAVSDAQGAPSLRIIADHARAATFLIADGVQPANEGRGYVLRKILRRGIRHGRLLGQEQPFMFEMVKAVRDEMKVAYPELIETAERVSKVVLAEEQQFARVISAGLYRLEEELTSGQVESVKFLLREYESKIRIDDIQGSANFLRNLMQVFRTRGGRHSQEGRKYFDEEYVPQIRKLLFPSGSRGLPEVHVEENAASEIADRLFQIWPPTFPGERAFYLYETFGLAIDFIVDVTRDFGITTDMAGFERAKEEEQARARASWKGGSQKSAAPVYRDLPKTEFEGYTATRLDGARILALVRDGLGVPALAAGETGEAVLDATSFYADSGGQVGDVGTLVSADHNTVVADVRGCSKPVQGVFSHRIVAREPIAVGDVVDTVVDADIRRATMRNHTGTHLLQAALREVLGSHVKQAGSLNDRSRLRFDFSHFNQVAEPELQQVEDIINRQILANTLVQTLVDVPIDEAVNDLGATALFGEKYGDRVRVVKIGDFSIELCGGTHIEALGEIGLLKLTGESSVSFGVRRVEAITGANSLASFRRDAEVARVASHFAGSSDASPAEALQARLSASEDELKRLRRELDAMRMKAASTSVANAADAAVEVKGVKVLSQRVDSLGSSPDAKGQMRTLVDNLRSKLGSGVVVLGSVTGEGAEARVSLIVGVTKDLTGRIQAGKLVAQLAPMVGGKGGGRPDLAEAGGNDVSALDSTLARVPATVESLL